MKDRFSSGTLTLSGHLAGSTSTGPARPAVVLIHGYPSGPAGRVGALAGMADLADRMADDMGWLAFSPSLRGVGDSEGNFSIGGWVEDVAAATAYVRSTNRITNLWLAGFGTGGALAICAGAADPTVAGVAALAAPADFDDWATNPRRLVEHARETGIIRTHSYPENAELFVRGLRTVQAENCARALAPRPLLLVHGNDDDTVPPIDARALADAHQSAELRFVDGAEHRLRHDPRAMAILLGWLDRQRHLATDPSHA